MVVRDNAKRAALGAAVSVMVLGGDAAASADPILPHVVGDLPDDTAIALHAPRLGALLAGGATLFSLWARAEPSVRGLAPESLLSLLLWGKPGTRPGAMAHGLDLRAPVVVRVLPDLETAVVVLPLLDGEQFRAWLRTLAAPSRVEVDFLGTPVDVLGPGSARPLACAVRGPRAFCQVGESEIASGLAPLAAHLGAPRATLGARPALARSWAEVADAADWTVLARPQLLARGAVRQYGKTQLQAHRFAPRELLEDVRGRIAHLERRSVKWAEHIEAVAIGVAAGVGGARISVVAELDAVGGRRLAAVLPSDSGRRQLRRWASTPALLSLFIHARPDPVARLGRLLGVDLDSAELDGSLAVLALAVDAGAPSARTSSREPLRFHELIASAVAVGLSRSPTAPKLAARSVPSRAPMRNGAYRGVTGSERQRVELARTRAPRGVTGNGAPRGVTGNGGGPMRGSQAVLERHKIFGRGSAGRYAALRRWRTAQEMALAPPEGFFFATLDLGAVDASLAAARITREHRPELQLVEQMRRRAAPMLGRLGRIRVVGNANPSRRQVRLRVRLGR